MAFSSGDGRILFHFTGSAGCSGNAVPGVACVGIVQASGCTVICAAAQAERGFRAVQRNLQRNGIAVIIVGGGV